MTRSLVWYSFGILFALFTACADFEKPTTPSTDFDIQLVNPVDSSIVADSLAPPDPAMWVESRIQGLRIRFNGQFSETTPDAISGVVDFEGYRVYLARDNVRNRYSIIAGYDLHDYHKWVWAQDSGRYVLFDIPYTIDSLRCLYADSCEDTNFSPRSYTRSSPYVHPDFPDSFYWFEPHDFNMSELGSTTPIRKAYPDEPDPSTLTPGELTPERFTDEGFLKYYEYEFDVDNLYPGMMHWVKVTVFDFGYAPLGIDPSETDFWSGAIGAYSLPRP
ncbi:MAG: hypothetical protein OEV49_14020 [candidate division Zixibacteria bacterium]|nr:hypothetical protein [candidate division Zixibacteria bacterium]MDH3938081.1 hypothetical protein [candidate division Zixibacteria bacterium]MDH4035649.1 hypothetical protein [candidate division Zixibacteria bacterium]